MRVLNLSASFILLSFQTTRTEKSPLLFVLVQNDGGVDVFESQSGHGYLYYHHPVKTFSSAEDLLKHVRRRPRSIERRNRMRKKKGNRIISKRRRNYKISAAF